MRDRVSARAVGLPPLVGYLVAGFVLHSLGYESSDGLETIADLGVLLLLFGIGLKLKIGTLAKPQVWGTATVFAVSATVVIGGVLWGLGALGSHWPVSSICKLRPSSGSPCRSRARSSP